MIGLCWQHRFVVMNIDVWPEEANILFADRLHHIMCLPPRRRGAWVGKTQQGSTPGPGDTRADVASTGYCNIYS